MTTPEVTSAASRLCASCGMCCNGVMFHIVKLQPGDSPRELASLGLKLKRKRKQDCILQPCPAHEESRCSIYDARPIRCRVFECQQLCLVATGAISEAAAQEKITAATTLIGEVNEILLRTGGNNVKLPLSKRCETAMAEPLHPTSDEASVRDRSRLERVMQKVNALLDQEFRIEPADPL